MSEVPDHIGVDLWRSFRAFEARMYDRLAQAGFDDVTVADSEVLVQIGPQGKTMVALAQGRGVSKQAVQGQVASLVRRGYLEVAPDAQDRRARRVTHSARGREMVAALASIKSDMQAELTQTVGAQGLQQLREALAQLRDALRQT
ncbi:MarR family winged helix-turn-helix transcriptional regulator [Sulfitobacter sp. S190]|uniref:MarR family winged helix-turn-helix transcriptional regulator n=1 Tax=Sulfitobacter sp. S190 TaxID=2867022 RepID=UPI0021A4FC89|nr:MarR family winged helix-turn-helix transcriptional regulator [Sulfitobacter sp. S190]UWR22807.1 MarR family winged helix-turn-helix transcriptional regulator [Sulfitobacter sp. S190]